MDSRRIICKDSRLGILIDSRSLDKLLASGNDRAKTLLSYRIAKHFQFVRSPLETDHEELMAIPELLLAVDEDGNWATAEIKTDEDEIMFGFPCRMDVVEHVARILYGKESVARTEREAGTLAFVEAALNRGTDTFLLVTDNEALLTKRLWLELHIPGSQLNIVTVEEAREVLDLFAKHHGKYHTCPNGFCNKGHWYWLSFRSKIPHYNVQEGILTGLANRFINILMSIDEMGKQFYQGVNNDTMRNTLYHFYYFITLLTGAFDSLAIKTKEQYQLSFQGDNIPSQTTLNPYPGRQFLRAIRDKHQKLHDFIDHYVQFRKLVYRLRESVIHREMPLETTFYLTGSEGSWKANFIHVDAEVVAFIRGCGDSDRAYDPFSEWGVYKSRKDFFLEPLYFSKSAGKVLSQFVDGYLKLLGFNNFVEQSPNTRTARAFIGSLRAFSSNRLGY